LWQIIKYYRSLRYLKTPIRTEKKENFLWLKLPKLEKFLYNIDFYIKKESLNSKFQDKHSKKVLIQRGVMEEAIASSQLEGASTSRRIAKQFLEEGRNPKDESEQMILNNYIAMQSIEEEYQKQDLSLDLLLELHNIITKDTLTFEGELPRLRKDQDEVYVTDKGSGIIYHAAPNISFVKEELKKLINFANDKEDLYFMHPVIKAIMLHFWVAYLHPFTDGNGRMARLLFYWYLLRKKYWIFTYLPISKVIKKSPVQYTMAYVYSEQDDHDLTYFIDYHIKKIEQALNDLEIFLAKEHDKELVLNKISKSKYDLGERQIRLLQFLNENSGERTSIIRYMNVFQVTNKTAIRDLKILLDYGFLERKRQGKTFYYYITDKFQELF